MSDAPVDEERFDLDSTDELPILLETVVLPADAADALLDDTGEHTARFMAAPADERSDVVALRTDLALRAARIDALETDIANLTARWHDVDLHLTAKDVTIKSLSENVASLGEALQRVESSEQRLQTSLADRDTALERMRNELTERGATIERARAQLAERDTTLERLRGELERRDSAVADLSAERSARDAALERVQAELAKQLAVVGARDDELGELRSAAVAEQAEIQRLRSALADKDAELARQRQSIGSHEAELQRSRMAIDAMRSEIETLRADLGARTGTPTQTQEIGRLREELAGLSTYIANRRTWWDSLEAEAAAANAKVVELQQSLVGAAARQRDAEAFAARESERASRLRTELAERSIELETLQRELAATRTTEADPNRRIAQLTAEVAAAKAAQAAAPAPELVADLKAEAERERERANAQVADLRDREQRLGAAGADIERLQRELASAQTELEQTRATTTRLERTLLDKEQALETRDARIAALQEELSQRLGALQRLNAMDLSLQGLDSKMSERLGRPSPSAEQTRLPALVCLTGDAPRQYALTKTATTIGRSSACDIQIMTHFVSREHARITLGPDGAQVEDLGSTNGVFVNAVRVERHELVHGDIVTVGETKFRFFESMAH